MSKYEQAYHSLVRRLNTLRKREKRLDAGKGALILLILLTSATMLALVLEAVFHLSSPGRFLLLAAGSFLSIGALLWFVARPLFFLLFRPDSPDDIHLALEVGNQFSQIRDRLADALQVFHKHEENREGYSLELADKSLAAVHEETRELDFESVVSLQPVKKMFRWLLTTVAVSVLIFVLFSSSLTSASYRLTHPARKFVHEIGLIFEVTPGDAEVVKGETVDISAAVRGADLAEVELFVKNEAASEFDRYVLSASGDRRFSYRLENVINNKAYYLAANGFHSDEFSISVIERPFVRSLQAKLSYPSYSRLGSQLLDENVGDISALKGTKVVLSLQTNKTVGVATIVFDDQSHAPLEISGQGLSGKFTLTRSGSYHIELTDRQGLSNEAPIEYRVSLVDDLFPIVEVPFPGQDVDLNKDMLLPLSIEAQDDFGISKLRIGYQILRQGVHESGLDYLELPLARSTPDKLLTNHNWDLSELNIYPEDIILYFAEAFDNDTVSGPKSSRSLTYRVRFPSIYELYEEVTEEHEETFEELEELYEESKALKETVDEVVQQMKRDPELDWEEKQEVQEAAQAQGKMREELEQLQEKLDEMVTRMEQNDLISPETLEKYRELQSLMEEMLSEEMKETLQKLQESMAELDPKQLKEAMEKFSATQEDFLRSMERTLNLLKKLQVEQKLDESIRKAQDLLRRQEELNKQADNSPDAAKQEKYAQQQRGIRQDTGGLEQDLEDLKNKMSEFPQMPQEQIDAAQSQISESGLQEQMEQAASQFQSGQMQSAQQSGQRISQGLQQALQSLQQAQEQLSQQQKQQIMQALKRSSHDLLDLSKQQESLMQSTRSSDRNTPGLGETANKQQGLLSGLNRITQQLYELSQNTFFVTSDIGKALGNAQHGMQESLEGLEARNPGKSGKEQGQAMAGLNEAASHLRSSMQSLSGASSGIGFQEMMERLMGLSGQQQGINQRTQGMGGEQGGLTMQQQAGMQRLAAEQAAVRKSLEQLMREAGKRSEVLGDLEKVGEDMQKVVEDLQKKKVNNNTYNRQKRILSRLLDAQRSMHDRDYSRKRRAETGKSYQTLSPATLPELADAEKERLKNELLKAMKEGYSKDYKELIQKYFEALASEQEQGVEN
ncbi:MAG: DUF4175 family protein [bacterium]